MEPSPQIEAGSQIAAAPLLVTAEAVALRWKGRQGLLPNCTPKKPSPPVLVPKAALAADLQIDFVTP